MKGCDWPLLKGRVGGEAGTRMSGALPDTDSLIRDLINQLR